MVGHEAHGFSNLCAGHAVSPDQLWAAQQVDLRMAVAKHMDVGRFVFVGEDDHAQARFSDHGDHGDHEP